MFGDASEANTSGAVSEANTSGATNVTIREATGDDWPLIFPFFRAVMDAGETYAYPSGLELEAGRDWWMEPEPTTVLAAESGGRIVGSAKYGPNRPGRGAHIGTASFIVDPSARGLGVGRALGEEVVTRCENAGFAGIQFNAVVETNEAAVRLWTSLGFQIVGTVPGAFDHPVHGRVGLHVMFLPLPRTAGP